MDEQATSSPGAAKALKVLFLSAEVDPFAKTGGLADVAGSLPKALRRMGHDIRVAMPAYGRIDRERFGLDPIVDPFPIPMGAETRPATIYQSMMGDGVPVYFTGNAHYFDRENIYGYEDDADRFVFYCRAALEMCRRIDWQPDVVHCNDWHTGIVPNWLHTVYAEDAFFKETATAYTIHNLQYQGIYDRHVLRVAGIEEYGFVVHSEVPQNLNEVVDLMARGILFTDVINTVSPTYAEEILTPEFGEGLDPLLRDRQGDLYGILNGIDTEEWNPATDDQIAATYDVDSLERRAENKLALQADVGLPQNSDVPVIGIITRLADQKGLDILEEAIDHILDLDVQFALLGVGERHYHNLFQRVADEYPSKAGITLTFNAPLARKIYAGSDMFLMPSRFEPCGLGQMLSMRYGSVPIVRAVGGLADTVFDYNPRTGEGNGFVFTDYDPWALFAAVVRAVEIYRHTDAWRQVQIRGMHTDFSWENSAQQYVTLYQRALKALHEPRSPVEYQVIEDRPIDREPASE
ncbi:MAG: Glycogen synthase [Anaerolineales bacterium]|nr:Glycogen synthase [Anaerolineales bacterium]